MTKFGFLKAVSIIASGSFVLFANDIVGAEEIYDQGAYGTINVGAGKYSDIDVGGGTTQEFDTGFTYFGSIGYDFGKTFRTDVSYSGTTSSTDLGGQDLNIDTKSFMVNAYVDFPNEGSKIAPFVGAGIGTTELDVSELCTPAADTDCTDNVFTYGIYGGVSYEISPKTDIVGQVAYLGYADADITNLGDTFTITGSETLSAYIGLKFNF